MIKIAISFAFLLFSLITFSQSTSRAFQGEFNGRLCDIGRGLCAISIPNNNKSITMKNFTITKKATNIIMIELDVKALNIDEQKRYFGKPYAEITKNEVLVFIQENDFIFPFETLILNDIHPLYQNLKKGNYPLTIVDSKIQITLTLTKD